MFGVFPLRPVPGRDYKSRKEVQEAFEAGKDFITVSNQRCSIRDFKGQSVPIRYKRNTEVAYFQA